MQLFAMRQIKAARTYAAQGGQALHLSGRWIVPGRNAPTDCAHLFDQDRDRLVETARLLGIHVVKLHGEGAQQHIDLWGGALEAALDSAAHESRRRIRQKLRTCADCGAQVPPGRGAFVVRKGKDVLVCAGGCLTNAKEV